MMWRRKRDGVIVITRQMTHGDSIGSSVLCRREDNGHHFWSSWSALEARYDRMASGGVVQPAGLVLMGEQGPERVVPLPHNYESGV
jgi:hypothetical protein